MNENEESIPLSIIISDDVNNDNINKNNNNNNEEEYSDDQELIINNDTLLDDDNVELKESKNKKQVPILAYIILGFALLSMSSSGVALKSIDAPPLLKASWRLQSTSILLLLGLIYEITILYNYHIKLIKLLPKSIILKLPIDNNNQFNKLTTTNDSEINELSINIKENEEKEETKKLLFQLKTIGILIGTGIMLGLHFSFWVVSLDKTTLAHSLLFVTSSPIMIVLVMLARRLPISKGEILGCILGFFGLIITLFDSLFLGNNDSSDENDSSDISVGQKPTLFGDFLALMGAVCIVFYLFAGSILRKWIPLFCYAFPVTFIASLFCSIASLIIEDTDLSLFSWLTPSFILLTLYLAVFPGFFGHTGMNATIKYIEPVIISVVLLLEPPIGSLMGWMVGVSGSPTFFTYIGGPFIIGGCLLVTISSHIKNKKQEI